MKFLCFLLLMFFWSAYCEATSCDDIYGASVVAQDDENTFLGVIGDKYESNSVFNPYGDYGSKYSSTSIWNDYADYGSKFSQYSATNKFSTSPPMIIRNKKLLGYITTNKTIKPSITPNMLNAICEQQ